MRSQSLLHGVQTYKSCIIDSEGKMVLGVKNAINVSVRNMGINFIIYTIFGKSSHEFNI